MRWHTDQILNLHDFERTARERMDAGAFAFYADGALDEVTLRENNAGSRGVGSVRASS